MADKETTNFCTKMGHKIIDNQINIGILTVSDRASKGQYEDLSGKCIISVLEEYLLSKWFPKYKLVPDHQEVIEQALLTMAQKDNCHLIFTTGGTGPAKRDVTVEATIAVCQKILPGFGEMMRFVSLLDVPTAILSRQTAGILDECMIVNLPGKPSAIRVCMEAVFPAIPYGLDLIGAPFIECNENYINIFRPQTHKK